MPYQEIQQPVFEILQEAHGVFLTVYQICQELEKRIPEICKRIIDKYQSSPGQPPMGAKAGTFYSIATFVALALASFYGPNHPRLVKEQLDSVNATFGGVTPGNKEGPISIWAWRQNTCP